ncbi:phosphoribosyltransferase [Acuticoccus sp. MNP-M23]|uniref:phosphoribosyltransferase n=1 Tax=Acuticoccus sp. MNP-M23 TaxID=3072793 RepID=UPI002815967A|nr:phosphoribosyltransferase [Acuticoccus sp. MNP-M23]WMS41135.1 phosphoribosyltransferase [Acuticoccus sp. MNP-M23]
MTGHFTRPTTDFWQQILPADDPAGNAEPPFQYGYPARLTDGRILVLPIRMVPDGERAVASLIANHASFAVNDALSDIMAGHADGADVVVGMPTLGLVFAPEMARRLGHTNYVPLGYSRKFWYDEALSEPVRSITTPGAGKRVYIDPNALPRLEGKRVVLVDDAISTGGTMVSVLHLLGKLGCAPERIVVAMRQGTAWRDALATVDPAMPDRVKSAFASPIFTRVETGWTPIPGSLDHSPM